MSYAIQRRGLRGLGTVEPWSHAYTSMNDVYMWRALPNKPVTTRDQLRLLAKVTGPAINQATTWTDGYGMNIIGAAVRPDNSVDVVFRTPGMGSASWPFNVTEETIAQRVASNDEVIRTFGSDFELNGLGTYTITNKSSTDKWRASAPIVDITLSSDLSKPVTTAAYEAYENLYYGGGADEVGGDGAAKPFTSGTPPLGGGKGDSISPELIDIANKIKAAGAAGNLTAGDLAALATLLTARCASEGGTWDANLFTCACKNGSKWSREEEIQSALLCATDRTKCTLRYLPSCTPPVTGGAIDNTMTALLIVGLAAAAAWYLTSDHGRQTVSKVRGSWK